MVKLIHVIGGGLAGLTLGIELRNRGVPVTIIEAGEYPRHRVCGEFISGRGVEVLRRLQLTDLLQHAGACEAKSAAFFVREKMAGLHALPASALCISRHVLDAALADQFRSGGGILQTQTREREMEPREGMVQATGRRAQAIDAEGTRWFGLKVHARGVSLAADLEMHIDRDAYVGLCRLGDGVVNVCGLFRRRAGESVAGMDSLRGRPGSTLQRRLQEAEFDQESFCAIAGLCLEPLPIDSGACRIGDSLTMIPPITGNGMSMAFESAEIAAEPITLFARGQQSWEETTRAIAGKLQSAFTDRLRWSQRFHHALFSAAGQDWLLPLMMRFGRPWRAAFALTRS